MTAISICLALGNAARGAEECVVLAQKAKKPAVVQAQSALASEMWERAAWWAKNIAEAK